MKRIAAMRSACVAAAGLVAAVAFVYGLAFLAFPQAKSRLAYRDPGTRPLPPPPPPPNVSSIWTTPLGGPSCIIEKIPRPDFFLAGTTISPNPSNCWAVVDSPAGQSLVRLGDRFGNTLLTGLAPSTATFSYGNASTQLKIARFDK
ncbi:MAG: hypothetical protein AAB074_21860 [Planctomycetota bacterium]